jgi:hypothetical protein
MIGIGALNICSPVCGVACRKLQPTSHHRDRRDGLRVIANVSSRKNCLLGVPMVLNDTWGRSNQCRSPGIGVQAVPRSVSRKLENDSKTNPCEVDR